MREARNSRTPAAASAGPAPAPARTAPAPARTSVAAAGPSAPAARPATAAAATTRTTVVVVPAGLTARVHPGGCPAIAVEPSAAQPPPSPRRSHDQQCDRDQSHDQDDGEHRTRSLLLIPVA